MKFFHLLALMLFSQGLFAYGQCFEGQTFIYKAYYDDLPNPGYRFSFLEGRLRLELPRLGEYGIDKEDPVRKLIEEPCALEKIGKFHYAALRDRKFLILSNCADVCVLVDFETRDSYWGLRDASPYILLKHPGKIARGNYIGIRGRLSNPCALYPWYV